ncbi:radical SAM superfamily protein [archaeon BMS3Abin16]|nr:radical SAM superfamily protein [archaeon BMS3Abin16]GBE55879.1 radical SAM superfamily protein [archaeon BMS3Bbin16]HDY73588.1 MSMEG_0568 family radical SAM protein [Euryarchaeota archaeon]
MDRFSLKTHLLCQGFTDKKGLLGAGRRGGAGPAGLAIEVDGFLVNIPLFQGETRKSKIEIKKGNGGLKAVADGNSYYVKKIGSPNFYTKSTSDGVPMKKIALLHGRDCLATTLYQSCILLKHGMGCGFCAIETSLQADRTILEKKPAQLAEVAVEAVRDGITHMTITTGTPNLRDHGSNMLASAVAAVKKNVDFPVHVQLTPPDRRGLERLHKSGADTIGIHVESFDKEVLKTVCPGKLGFDYTGAFKEAVEVFGENQVSSIVIAGLGEDPKLMKTGFEELASIGVIPFLVPFRPLPGSLLENRQPPKPGYMKKLYIDLAHVMHESGLRMDRHRAGCVKCGACSAVDLAMDA